MGWSTGTCDQVWSKSVTSCRRYKTLKCWQKKKKKKKNKKKKEIVQKKYTVADCDCVNSYWFAGIVYVFQLCARRFLIWIQGKHFQRVRIKEQLQNSKWAFPFHEKELKFTAICHKNINNLISIVNSYNKFPV